jgi:hypothetical protein
MKFTYRDIRKSPPEMVFETIAPDIIAADAAFEQEKGLKIVKSVFITVTVQNEDY